MTPQGLKEARTKAKLTQLALSTYLGCSVSQVQKWEAGIHPVSNYVSIIYRLGGFKK